MLLHSIYTLVFTVLMHEGGQLTTSIRAGENNNNDNNNNNNKKEKEKEKKKKKRGPFLWFCHSCCLLFRKHFTGHRPSLSAGQRGRTDGFHRVLTIEVTKRELGYCPVVDYKSSSCQRRPLILLPTIVMLAMWYQLTLSLSLYIYIYLYEYAI